LSKLGNTQEILGDGIGTSNILFRRRGELW